MRALANFDLGKERIEDWLRDQGGHAPEDHQHGNANVASTVVVGRFDPTLRQLVDAVPISPHGTPTRPPTGGACNRCGYWQDCTRCGAWAVLSELETALGDRAARAYAIEFSHEVSTWMGDYLKPRTAFKQKMFLRDLASHFPKAMKAFTSGENAHREQTLARVRAGAERMRQRGYQPFDVDAQLAAEFPRQETLQRLAAHAIHVAEQSDAPIPRHVLSRALRDAAEVGNGPANETITLLLIRGELTEHRVHDDRCIWTPARAAAAGMPVVPWNGNDFRCESCGSTWTWMVHEWHAPCPGCGSYVANELLNLRESPRKRHVDPDRSLLGSLQEHLYAHGFSYLDIARLIPDGEGGTESQQRRRVENRLRKRYPRNRR